MQILNNFSKKDWNRVVKALLVMGSKVLLKAYDPRTLTSREIEDIAYDFHPPNEEELRYRSLYHSPNRFQEQSPHHSPNRHRFHGTSQKELERTWGHEEQVDYDQYYERESSTARPNSEMSLLIKHIADIKQKLVHLDNKVDMELARPMGELMGRSPQKKLEEWQKTKYDSHKARKKQQEALESYIYPSWWVHGSTKGVKGGMYKRNRWQDEEWRRRYELECSELAKQNYKLNESLSARRPIRMTYEKKEFVGANIGKIPQPVTFEAPPRESPQQDVEGKRQIIDVVNNTAGSPVVNHFAFEGAPREAKPQYQPDYQKGSVMKSQEGQYKDSSYGPENDGGNFSDPDNQQMPNPRPEYPRHQNAPPAEDYDPNNNPPSDNMYATGTSGPKYAKRYEQPPPQPKEPQYNDSNKKGVTAARSSQGSEQDQMSDQPQFANSRGFDQPPQKAVRFEQPPKEEDQVPVQEANKFKPPTQKVHRKSQDDLGAVATQSSKEFNSSTDAQKKPGRDAQYARPKKMGTVALH